MMTPEQIAAMRADAEAGTKGPFTVVAKGNRTMVCDAEYDRIAEVSGASHGVDGRRFSRVPDMEATILAQAAEIERLKSGIPWRDGPPPEEWRDGRSVAVYAAGAEAAIARWDGNAWSMGFWYLRDEYVTHHAAITKPGEKE